jgi:hypothetical protein
MSTKFDIFDAYPVAADGLAAWANVDHDAWSAFVDSAAEKQYDTERASWVRSLTQSVRKDALKANNGQARLFEPPESATRVELRERIVWSGQEYLLADLAGRDGAAVLRKAMQRDLKPALTTVQRCRNGLALADHIEGESDRLGRDVSVSEVVSLGEAA